MKKTKRFGSKLLSVMLSFALVMTTLVFAEPLSASAAQITGGVIYCYADNSNSGTGWDWNHVTKTLTLTDLNYLSTDSEAFYIIPESITIVLNGENYITCEGETGIYSTSLTIREGASGGKLIATANTNGICAGYDGSLTLESGTVEANAIAGVGLLVDGDITVNGGLLKGKGVSRGISFNYAPPHALNASISKPIGGIFTGRFFYEADGSTFAKEVELTPATAKTLSGIAVKTAPTKTAYTVGESFDPTGMVIEASYSDGTKADVTGYTVAPNGALAVGDTKVTITYVEGGVTQTVDQAITVTAPVQKTLTGIRVKTAPTKTAYTVGESFDPTGMVIEASYSDGTKADVTGYTVAPSGALAVGDTKVTITYVEGGVTQTVDQAITVTAPVQKTLTGIRVKTAPTKTTYTVGESFDPTGMVIEASYSDGTKADVTCYTVAPSGALAVGDTKVTITYVEGGVTQTVDQAITVTAPVQKTLTGIRVKTAPTKTTYTVGESFDPTGMVIEASYSDGTKADVTGYTVAPNGALAVSDNKVTITYVEGGVTKTVNQAITVTDGTPVTKAELLKAISTAKTVKGNTAVSIDGTDVAKNRYWVTKDIMDALNKAINDATAVVTKAKPTADQLSAAKAALDQAVNAFKAAKAMGTK